MYRKILRLHSYWKERDPFRVESVFRGCSEPGARDIGEWLGFVGSI